MSPRRCGKSLALVRRSKKHVREKKQKAAQRLDRPGSKLACHERWLDRVRLPEAKDLGLYLSLDDKGRPYLDKDKVKRAEHLDGKFVLTTNDDTLSVADIALGYKSMWIIENCFKTMKTTGLGVRPMFHWVNSDSVHQRITAHVKLCVLALMIQRCRVAHRDHLDQHPDRKTGNCSNDKSDQIGSDNSEKTRYYKA